MTKTVTISIKEYRDLQLDALFLAALEGFGVDNWSGYDECRGYYEGYEEAKKAINDEYEYLKNKVEETQ